MPNAKHLEEANAALTQWLSPEQCGHLVSAVISKYIALTPEELEEWQVQLFATWKGKHDSNFAVDNIIAVRQKSEKSCIYT